MTDLKPYRRRFLARTAPLTTPGRWRDVQELLHQCGIEVSHETLHEWCIKFAPLFTEKLRHRDTDAAKLLLTRLLDEYDVPKVIHTDQLRSYRAATRELPTLDHVGHQQVISTSRCNNIIEQSHRPTRRQERQRVSVLMGRSGTLMGVRSRRQLFCSRQQQGFKRRKRAQKFLNLHARIGNLHHYTRASVSATTRRNNQKRVFQTCSTVAAGVA